MLHLSDDLLFTILTKLESDPRDWARVACSCCRLETLISSLRSNSVLTRSLPPPLTSSLPLPHLHTLSVCCPGLRSSGSLLHHSDFGLVLDIGPSIPLAVSYETCIINTPPSPSPAWSLLDDLYLDTLYDNSESHLPVTVASSIVNDDLSDVDIDRQCMKRRKVGPTGAHLASGAWTLSREQGNKLLASRFRGESLYICDWPGCVHEEEKRKYMVFRGVFTNFKRSRVWRTINDGNRSRIGMECTFCECREMWDLHSAFCLRKVFEYHDDGEPAVRAYVCENGHVVGAWTEQPLCN